MTVSLNKALCLWLLGASVAFAQPPRDIAPAFQPSPAPPQMDSDASDMQDTPGPLDEDVPRSPPIREQAIGAPSDEGYGTLEGGHGGLGAAIWQGGERQGDEAWLRDIHGGVADETLRDLTTRLLLTEAAPPPGPATDDWFALRVRALVAMGEDGKADQMLASLPGSMMSKPLLQLQVELKLLRGEYDHACQQSASVGADTNDTHDFWHKLVVFCKAHGGKKDEAMVGLDVLQGDSATATDVFFSETVRKIIDRNTVVRATPKEWSLFDVALVRRANDIDKIKEHLDELPGVALKYIAQDGSYDVKLRERATTRAQLMGILPVQEGNRTPEPTFTRALASDVTSLVRAFGSGRPPSEADNIVIARLDVGSGAAISDCHRVQRLLTLMEPFGYRVPPEIWRKLFLHRNRYDGDMPPASLIARLEDAGKVGRKGDVVLLSALIAGGGDTQRMTDAALLPIVRALKAVGFEKEAHGFAYGAVKRYE